MNCLLSIPVLFNQKNISAPYFKQHYFNTVIAEISVRDFLFFVLLAESTKFCSIRKPYTFTSVCYAALAVQKFIANESPLTAEYEIFMCTEISAIAVLVLI